MDTDTNNYQSSHGLPKPLSYSGQNPLHEETSASNKAENIPASSELPKVAPSAVNNHTQQQPKMPQPPPLTVVTDGSNSQLAQAQNPPISADDADLIEKEWVIKAKSIVENTKDDPHQQNKEMSKFKADYIKKRYNKEVKVVKD